MRYLNELHTKSDEHKKRFAFLSAGAATLAIFGFWSLATFGTDTSVVVEESNEVSPLESLSASVTSSIDGLKKSFQDLTSTNKL